MKKVIIGIMVIVIAIMFVGCSGGGSGSDSSPSKVSLAFTTGSQMEIQKGNSAKLIVQETGSTNAIEWKSSNSAVVSVDQSGNITGVAAGTAQITADIAGTDVDAVCSVTVTEGPVGSVTLSVHNLPLQVGQSSQIFAQVSPTGQVPTWSVVQGADVVTVDQSGNVVAVKNGTAVVEASITIDNQVYKDDCTVVVTSTPTIEMDQPTWSGYETEGSFPLKATTNIETPNITWISSNSNVVDVNASTGFVTIKGSGNAVITAAMNYNGQTYTAKCNVTINKAQITASATQTLAVGQSQSLDVVTTPSDMPVTSVSDNTAVATVTNGVVTAVAPGTATITSTINGTQESTKTVVTVSPTLTLNATKVTLDEAKTFQLIATTVPSGATVSWSTNASSIATVDQSGMVSTHYTGQATITATMLYNGEYYTAQCEVTVSDSASVNITPSNLSKYETDVPFTLVPQSNVDNPKYTWSSTNPSAAVVDSNGEVTIKGVGSAMIMVALNDTSASAGCQLTVNPDTISLPASETIAAHSSVTLTPITTPSTSSINWTSDNASVATVANGVVTGIAPGMAHITAKIVGTNASATTTVMVNDVAKSVTMSQSSMELSTAQLHTGVWITATTDPSGLSVNYISEDSSIATIQRVMNQGVWGVLVTPTGAEGTTYIDAYVSGSSLPPAKCQVVVQNPSILLPSSVTLNCTSSSNTVQLTPTVFPSNAKITWTSLVPSIATVTSTGLVTGVSAGQVLIQAKIDGMTVPTSCTVTVKPTVQLDNHTLIIAPNSTAQLNATVYPTKDSVLFLSSNKNIATVDPSTGKITAGTQTGVVTITAQDGTGAAMSSDSCQVYVADISTLSQNTILKNVLVVGPNSNVDLTKLFTVSPSNLPVSLTYSSDDSSVVQVNGTTGAVTTNIDKSSAIITASIPGTSISKQFNVSVSNPTLQDFSAKNITANSITLNFPSTSLTYGNSVKIYRYGSPTKSMWNLISTINYDPSNLVMSYVDSGLSPNTQYHYQVKVYNCLGIEIPVFNGESFSTTSK